MSKNLEEIMKDDNGIDLEHYSLDEEISKYDGVDPVGYQILVRVYVPKTPDKINNIFLSEETMAKMQQDARLTNLTGLVIKLAPGVYKDKERYSLTGDYCTVGDWVQFARATGYSFAHNKLTSIYMVEDAIVGKIKDPRTITRVVN